jgi:hypothetical protein
MQEILPFKVTLRWPEVFRILSWSEDDVVFQGGGAHREYGVPKRLTSSSFKRGRVHFCPV